MQIKPSFVFDTNTVVSAALIPSSVNRQALQKAETIGNVVFSEETLNELIDVLLSRSLINIYLLKNG